MKAHVLVGLCLVLFFLAAAMSPSRSFGQSAAVAPPAAAPPPPPPPPPPPATAAVKRAKVTCKQYRADVEKTAKSAAFDTRLKAGSWGHIPSGLRKLPRRARLCGADSMGQVVIASALSGKELEDFYTPIFTKLEFTSVNWQTSNGQTRCHAKRHRDISILVTDATREAFVMSFLARQNAPLPMAGHDK